MKEGWTSKTEAALTEFQPTKNKPEEANNNNKTRYKLQRHLNQVILYTDSSNMLQIGHKAGW